MDEQIPTTTEEARHQRLPWARLEGEDADAYEGFITYLHSHEATTLGEVEETWVERYEWLSRAARYHAFMRQRAQEQQHSSYNRNVKAYHDEQRRIADHMRKLADDLIEVATTGLESLNADQLTPTDVTNLLRVGLKAQQVSTELGAHTIGVNELIKELAGVRRKERG